MTITVRTTIAAPVDQVWAAYTSPQDIIHWNAASDDWHTPSAQVDLRVGGRFCWRMEARDGSAGFDFEGQYTEIQPRQLIAYRFGDRLARVRFCPEADGTEVQITFEAEHRHAIEQQRQGWQAILDNFRRHVEARGRNRAGREQ